MSNLHKNSWTVSNPGFTYTSALIEITGLELRHLFCLFCLVTVLSRDVSMINSKSCSGVIQQIRGPNFTQFWPPTPLEWTFVDILQTTCTLFLWPSTDFLLITYPPYLVQVVIEWPLSRESLLVLIKWVYFLVRHSALVMCCESLPLYAVSNIGTRFPLRLEFKGLLFFQRWHSTFCCNLQLWKTASTV